jgi:tRNA-dihydrouridine synthase A
MVVIVDNSVERMKSLHIAPMLDVSGREFRQLMRILSRRAVLWTEMVVDTTIIHTKEMDYHLDYERDNSHPIICQIGGNDGNLIQKACEMILEYEYTELNLNLDCPSNRVAGKRQFGAALMKQPEVAESVLLAMHAVTKKLPILEGETAEAKDDYTRQHCPISVKCRIGVDEMDTLDDMIALISRLKKYCRIFYLHARKAILGGLLNPAQNRSVPPLNYPRVYQICILFPDCAFYVNGGIMDLKAAKEICYGRPPDIDNNMDGHSSVPCRTCDLPNGSCIAPLPIGNIPTNLLGCMLGRIAMDNPCILWDVDRYFYGEERNPCQTRREILKHYCLYIQRMYPRRCCDRDPRVTSKITDPKNLAFQYDACQICSDLLQSTDFLNSKRTLSIAPPHQASNDTVQGGGDVRVATIVMDRCIKPINNIFCGQPCSKVFRQEVNRLARDRSVRNCGPAALIARALTVVPTEILDQELVATERLHL